MGVLREHVPRGVRDLAGALLPVALVVGRAFDFAEHELDDPLEDVILVLDVVVERHRFDAELGGKLAHAERLESVLVDEAQRHPEDAVAIQPLAAGRCSRSAFGCGMSASFYDAGHLTPLSALSCTRCLARRTEARKCK